MTTQRHAGSHIGRCRGAILVALALARCATNAPPGAPEHARRTAAEGRALVGRSLPVSIADRAGWATDMYPMTGTVRDEVFSRRGGLYFGIAHLLDYRAPYDRYVYRFADYNAGRYASRNAAFQRAVTDVSGIPLTPDGDLVRYDGGKPSGDAGNTELALRVMATRLGMSTGDIRRDLELGKGEAFERTLYARVFALADEAARKRVPRAVVPTIVLSSPKITRRLTTDWFAHRVDERFRACLARNTH